MFTSSDDGALFDTRIREWHKHPIRLNYRRTHAHIASVADLKATIRNGAFAWPGGYPLFFITDDGAALCFDCGQKEAKRIIANHGEKCETFKTATAFLAEVDKQEETTEDNQEQWNDLCADFLKSILEDYSIMLQEESEYLVSDDVVDESIQCNGYTFTETGKRFG